MRWHGPVTLRMIPAGAGVCHLGLAWFGSNQALSCGTLHTTRRRDCESSVDAAPNGCYTDAYP
jgi:hypothetical protein